MDNFRPWVAELVGTYGFVTIGAGAGIIAGAGLADLGLFGVAIANGVALAVMVTTFMAISGGHLNPAVTLSMLIGRRISAVDALGYVSCQILGALGAAVTLRFIFQETVWRAGNLGAPALATSTGSGILAEAVFTFFLVMVVWGVVDSRGPRVGGFSIGLVVAVGVLAVGPLTGGSFNPARYIGPAAVIGELDRWWVYFAGPAIGGAVAGVLYPAAFLRFPWAKGEPPAPETAAPDTAEAVKAKPKPKPKAKKAAPRRKAT